MLIDDMSFSRSDPGPGDTLPDFDLSTAQGGSFSASTLGERPVLLIFGSRTCPVTESAMPRIRQLHDDLGDQVRFVLVNTREAHPGGAFDQPTTHAYKLERGAALRHHHQLDFDVAIDDIDGTLHRSLSPKPNSAYLVDTDGTIVFRSHWANDDAAIRQALERHLAGLSTKGTSRAMLRPLMRAVGHLPGIIRDGGSPKIERDIWQAALPLALLGRISTWLTPLPTDSRGAVAAALVATTTATVAATAVAVI